VGKEPRVAVETGEPISTGELRARSGQREVDKTEEENGSCSSYEGTVGVLWGKSCTLGTVRQRGSSRTIRVLPRRKKSCFACKRRGLLLGTSTTLFIVFKTRSI